MFQDYVSNKISVNTIIKQMNEISLLKSVLLTSDEIKNLSKVKYPLLMMKEGEEDKISIKNQFFKVFK